MFPGNFVRPVPAAIAAAGQDEVQYVLCSVWNPVLFQPVKVFPVRTVHAVFEGISHFLIKRQAGDRGRNLDASGPPGEFILFQCQNNRSPDPIPLLCRMHEDGKQTALIFTSPVRADGTAADDLTIFLCHIKMRPACPLKNMLRGLLCCK